MGRWGDIFDKHFITDPASRIPGDCVREILRSEGVRGGAAQKSFKTWLEQVHGICTVRPGNRIEYIGLKLRPPRQTSELGRRFSDDKLRLDLIPVEWRVELARVMTAGAYKYAERNWEKGMDWSKCLGPLHRHLARWEAGQTFADAETRCHELACVAWNALALMSYELRKLGKDDRSKVLIGPDFKWTEGPGTDLGMTEEQISEVKAKYRGKS